MNEPKLFVATKGFILHEGKMLLLREAVTNPDGANFGKYDVPGGRITPGESIFEAVKREIMEEVGLEVTVEKPFFASEWKPVVRGEQWHIVAVFFLCSTDNPNVVLNEEHDQFLWLDPQDVFGYPLMAGIGEVTQTYIDMTGDKKSGS